MQPVRVRDLTEPAHTPMKRVEGRFLTSTNFQLPLRRRNGERPGRPCCSRGGVPAAVISLTVLNFLARPLQSNLEDSFAGGVQMKLMADLIKHLSHFGA